jgi:glutathione synthase
METRYLIVADPIEALNPVFDLGVCLSRELLRRGIKTDYLDLLSSDRNQAPDSYLVSLPVREILEADATQKDFWRLGKVESRPVTDYRIILQRKDPPVDDVFKAYARLFESTPSEIIQINTPPANYELSEHTLALEFPDYAAPTAVCTSFAALVDAVRSQPGEAVCKPLHTYCGIGIEFVPSDVPEELLAPFWESWGPQVIVQPFLKEIENSGDLRILTINDRVLGSVLRVPAEGSRLANLHQGAHAAALAPSERQLEACRAVARALNPKGLYLLGLDFIGDYLTEINITSPTTIVQINQVNNIRADVDLIDELERMWRKEAGVE